MSFELERFVADRLERRLGLGDPIRWSEATESTNDDALVAAKAGAPHGALFGAESQSHGRGRRGSEWVSPPGAGLWFSLVLRPHLDPEAAPALALCAGLAVREAAARRIPGAALVKWPNDVWVGPRKLAGVLVESQISGPRMASVVVGIGVNVAQTSFPDSIAATATSLVLAGAHELARETLLADVLESLQSRLALLESRGVAGIADELRRHDALLGATLRVEGRAGTGAGIDDQGRLLLRRPGGDLEPVVSGHVEVVRP